VAASLLRPIWNSQHAQSIGWLVTRFLQFLQSTYAFFIGQLVLANNMFCFPSVGLSVRGKCGQTVTDRPIVTMGDYWETIGWELNATFTIGLG